MIQFLQQPVFILAAAFLAVAFVLLWFIVDLKIKWRKLFGRKAIPGGELLKELIGRIAKSETRLDDAESRINILEEIARISVQKVGFLRFNPFSDTGGDQSFSLALLDRENNGVVVSSLYAREGTRVYAKAIKNSQPRQPLSEEERRVLGEALGKK